MMAALCHVQRSSVWRLLLTVTLCITLLSVAEARIPSLTLRDARLNASFYYAMYSGATVPGEALLSTVTTYPYVFSSDMNTMVVAMLKGYLVAVNKTAASVGGSFDTCMGTGGSDSTGKTCYKALLAAATPSDCPLPNVLCCPLFWRTTTQDSTTKMAKVDNQTVLWNGAVAINGYFANFSDDYLRLHSNCSVALFTGSDSLGVAVDVTGEWRFVPLLTSYTLLETTIDKATAATTTYFNNTKPEYLIGNATANQEPLFKVVTPVYIPVAICGGLLVVIWLFLILGMCCGANRSAKRVHATQARLLQQKAEAPALTKESLSVYQGITCDVSSRSSSEESRRSRRISAISRQASQRGMRNDDYEAGDDGRSRGSSRSLTSKQRQQEPNFPQRPDALPGIRSRGNSMMGGNGGNGRPPAAASASQRGGRPGSTNTTAHDVNSRRQSTR